MKKVISALTAAAMCASMSASVMTAFAVYSANDVEFYLKVASASAGTVSADGSTITFANAAEAKGAKLVVQEFIKADASNPSVQQVGSTFSVSDKAISLGDGVSYSDPIGDAKEYTLNGNTVTTDCFVSCFAYSNKRKKFASGTGDASWGHSKDYTWEYTGVDQLSIIWASSFDDPNYDNSTETAHFAGDASDAFPFTQFDATIGDVADGTYTIDIIDSWEHAENGTQNGTFVNVDGKNKVLITNHPGITIVIGDGAASQDTTAPAEDTTAPAEDTTAPAETEPVTDTPAATKGNYSEWTWWMSDEYYDPAADPDGVDGACVKVYVSADPGTYGYDFTPLIDGKTAAEAGFEILEIAKSGAYTFETFQVNPKNGHVGAASKAEGNATAKEGEQVLEMYLLPPADAAEGTKYEISFKDLTVGNFAGEKSTPATVNGSITIGKAGTQPTTTEAPKDDTTEAPKDDTTEPKEDTTAPSTDVKYLYGDVNENGKVELVDIVKLNRFLTGTDKELTAVATVNANCFRAGESDADTKTANLDGKDSVAILRYLIGLVETLPTQG